jgi:hypothetical protein
MTTPKLDMSKYVEQNIPAWFRDHGLGGVQAVHWVTNQESLKELTNKATLVNLAAAAKVDLGIRGGIRVPHIHYDEKIYLLNEAQWAEFSKGVISKAKAKLAEVKEISFDEALALGSITQALGRK